MVLRCWLPADGPVHKRSSPEGPLAASRAPDGWPPGWAGPGRQGAGAVLPVPVTGCHAAPVSGPPNRTPPGASRYAVVPVSMREAALPVPARPRPDAPGTGAHLLLPAALE